MTPWNNWYHCMFSTYGTWLRGDPRGYHERHHRRHVEGDYKHPPPPGSHATQLQRSLKLMPEPALFLSLEQQSHVGRWLVHSFHERSIELLVLTLDAHHIHLLARFPDHRPRHWVGLAKKHAYHQYIEQYGIRRRLWGKRSECLPIRDRAHQVNVFHYILRHRQTGAWTWSFRDPLPPTS